MMRSSEGIRVMGTSLEELHGWWWPKNGTHKGAKYLASTKDLDLAIAHCTDRRSCVQAGGHVGAWPKYLSERFKNVYTFEPEFANFCCLSINVMEPNVFKFNAALGHKHGGISMKVVENIGGHRVQMDSDVPGHRDQVSGPTPMLCVDDLELTDCDLICLDIEGYEYPALLGATATIDACRPVVMIEDKGHGIAKGRGDTFEDIQKFLGYWHYSIVGRIHKDVIFATKVKP